MEKQRHRQTKHPILVPEPTLNPKYHRDSEPHEKGRQIHALGDEAEQ